MEHAICSFVSNIGQYDVKHDAGDDKIDDAHHVDNCDVGGNNGGRHTSSLTHVFILHQLCTVGLNTFLDIKTNARCCKESNHEKEIYNDEQEETTCVRKLAVILLFTNLHQ